jgi:hypothetical protein
MRTWKTKSFWAALFCFFAVFAVPMAADAFSIVDVEDAIDATHVFDPYTFQTARDLMNACSDVNNIIGCVEANSENLPPQMQTMIDIFVDIQGHNYDQLIEDGGQTVFCAAMKVITGIPVCDLIADAEALPKDVAAIVGPAVNSFVCDLNIGGINCAGGSPGWGTLPYGFDCGYYPGQYIPPLKQANQQLQAQVDASLVIPPDNPQPSYCQSQFCISSSEICGAPNTYGQCYCSHCPQGQAMQNGTCSSCAPQSGTDLSQSADKRSWTRVMWTNDYAPSFDGSHCLETGGSSNQQVWNCPSGQISPEYGKCAPACPIGQVFDQGSQTCMSCPNGYSAYQQDGNSIGKCVACPLGMESKDGGAVCACPNGYGQDNAASACKMCPANSYANFGVCTACADRWSSAPGSTFCKELACPPGSHALNHICMPDDIHFAPSGVSGGPAIINRSCVAGTHMENGQCVQNGFMAPSPNTPPQVAPPAKSEPFTVPPSGALECPPLSHWDGRTCIGPRGKAFCPEDSAMRDGVCERGQAAGICPTLSHWDGRTCIGPRGKAFCPSDMRMLDGVCVR